MHDSNHTSYINFIGFEKEKKKTACKHQARRNLKLALKKNLK